MNTYTPPGLAFPEKETDYHGHPNYLKVFKYLLIFLTISLVASYLFSAVFAVLLIFITAIIKAGLVVGNFMHLKFEPRLIWLVLSVFVFIVLTFFWCVFPDVTIIHRDVFGY